LELSDWFAELSPAAVMAKSPEVKLAVFGRAGVGKSGKVMIKYSNIVKCA